MSPPEVWGPAVWTLFHTLAEKLNPNVYNKMSTSFFGIIVQICKLLPCPECSKDASNFLAKINLKDYKTKDEFKNMLYLFHNWVNAKKRKRLFNYANMDKYKNLPLSFVIKDFISKYNTKGNMNLISESFQRSFVIRNFISWFSSCSRAFASPVNQAVQVPDELSLKTHDIVIEETSVPDVEETSVPVVDENPLQVVDETLAPVVDENPLPVVDETLAPVVEETSVPVVEETSIPVVDENPLPVVEETPAIVVEDINLSISSEEDENASFLNDSLAISTPTEELIDSISTLTEESREEIQVIEQVKPKRGRKSKK
jgi:hypothetical protein